MNAPDKTKQILDAERRILSLICQAPARGTVRSELERELADYSWREREHQIVFEVLQEIPSSNPQTIRQQLPVRLTRKGFPDLNLETYFQPCDLANSQPARSIRSLLKLLRDVKLSEPSQPR